MSSQNKNCKTKTCTQDTGFVQVVELMGHYSLINNQNAAAGIDRQSRCANGQDSSATLW